MRSYLVLAAGLAGIVAVTARCGGAVDTPGSGGGDASTDGTSDSGGSSSGSSGGSGASSSSGGSSGSSGSGEGGGPACAVACLSNQQCCGGRCSDPLDDPFNCGTCGNACEPSSPVCENGKCVPAPCDKGTSTCQSSQTCCGTNCCTSGQICCVVEGGPVTGPRCITPTSSQPTCPTGCLACQ